MGMTFWRWSAAVAIGCAAITATMVPFPPTVSKSWSAVAPEPLATEIAKLTIVAAQAHVAVRAYRNAEALDRWTAAAKNAETTLVRIDRSVPASIAPAIRALAADQWASLGARVSAANAEVYVFVDSTFIPRARDAVASRRVLEARRGLIDVTFALPQATDGARCVTLVRLRGVSPARVAALRNQSVIGVCGFYAAFGVPGPVVQRWLAGTNYRFAWHSDWSVARPPATDATSRYALGSAAARCLVGARDACPDALHLTTTSDSARLPAQRLAWVLDAAIGTSVAAETGPTGLGDGEKGFLADAVRLLGPERFARFWTAASAPQPAFVAAAGIGLDAWTQQWLARTYGAATTAPTVGARDLVWLALAVALAVFVASRPRHRVLDERLFASRG